MEISNSSAKIKTKKKYQQTTIMAVLENSNNNQFNINKYERTKKNGVLSR